MLSSLTSSFATTLSSRSSRTNRDRARLNCQAWAHGLQLAMSSTSLQTSQSKILAWLGSPSHPQMKRISSASFVARASGWAGYSRVVLRTL